MYIQHVQYGHIEKAKSKKKKTPEKKKTKKKQRTKRHGKSHLYPHSSGLRHLAYHTVQGKS